MLNEGGFLYRSGGTGTSSEPQFPTSTSSWDTLISDLGMNLGTPSIIWMFDELSGNIVDEVSSTTLSVTGTPTYNVTPTAFPSDTGISMTGSQRFDAAVNTVLNFDENTSFFNFTVVQFGTLAASDHVFNKKASGIGYNLVTDGSGQLTFHIDDNSDADDLITTGQDHSNSTVLLGSGVDRNDTKVHFFTPLSAEQKVLITTGTLANNDNFQYGRQSGGTAIMSPLIYSVWWVGAAAEGAVLADWTAYNTHLGL